jgi:hypothetical protein
MTGQSLISTYQTNDLTPWNEVIPFPKEGEDTMIEWLKGKKSYIVWTVTFILAGLKGVGVEVPAWVILMLGSLGMVTTRAGISKAE